MCASRQRMGLKLSCIDALCFIVMSARKPLRNHERLIWRSPKQKRKRQRATAWHSHSYSLGFDRISARF